MLEKEEETPSERNWTFDQIKSIMSQVWKITLIIGSISFLVGVIYCYVERRRILKHLGGLNRYPEIPIMGSTHLIAFRNTESG